MMTCYGNSREPISRKESILSRRQIEGMIAEGRSITIFDGKVLKVDAWLQYHPGGEKSIMHMVGRDATDEINAYVEFDSFQKLADRTIDQSSFLYCAPANAEFPNW